MKREKNPVTLELAAAALTDRERIWTAIRELKTFDARDLGRKTGLDRRKKSVFRDYLSALHLGGFITPSGVRIEPRAPIIWKLIKDTGVDAPRVRKDGTVLPPSGRQRMWNAIRILKGFTATGLASIASLPGHAIAGSEAEYYCRWLEKGGYLRRSRDFWVFVPAMFTGAKAPQVLRVKALFDPNTGKTFCGGETMDALNRAEARGEK
jgi:hypothetical protein